MLYLYLLVTIAFVFGVVFVFDFLVNKNNFQVLLSPPCITIAEEDCQQPIQIRVSIQGKCCGGHDSDGGDHDGDGGDGEH